MVLPIYFKESSKRYDCEIPMNRKGYPNCDTEPGGGTTTQATEAMSRIDTKYMAVEFDEQFILTENPSQATYTQKCINKKRFV